MSIVNTSANPGSDANGATVKCPFDALWRRREKIEYVPDGTAVTNRYIYKDWLVLAITDGSGALLETYTHGADLSGEVGGEAGGIGGILASTQSGGAAFYAYDFNGNIIQVSAADQTQLAKHTYFPSGDVFLKEGLFDSLYQFSTKELDDPTGLTYYGYRHYASSLGRWISPDPLSDYAFSAHIVHHAWNRHRSELFKASLELRYVFISNKPLSRLDPMGLFAWPWPLNSRVCNKSSDQCMIVWYDKSNYSLLKPGECTSFWLDRGDFAYWNGDWFKCRGGMTCSIDDRPIDDYSDASNYLPPVGAVDFYDNWHPDPPGEDLCKQYCDCNAKSSRIGEMKDQCDCIDKCRGKQ